MKLVDKTQVPIAQSSQFGLGKLRQRPARHLDLAGAAMVEAAEQMH
jgi:hypothetical protein